MRQTRRPSWLVGLRLLAALAIGGGAYAVYLMACGSSDTTSLTPSIVPTSPPYGTYEVAFSDTFTVTSSSDTYTWSVTDPTNLPPNVTMNSTTGILSGLPDTAGFYNFHVLATSTTGKANVGPTPMCLNMFFQVTPAELNAATVGVAYTQQLGGKGGTKPYASNWTLLSNSNQLPTGVTLSSSGLLSGTPAAGTQGTYIFTAQGFDANGAIGRKVDTLTVVAAASPLTITPAGPALPAGTAGTSYNNGTGVQLTASGGSGAGYMWALGTGSGPLPLTLALGPTTGLLSGPLTTAGSYSFSVKVTDGATNTVTQPYTISVAIGVTPSSVPSATVAVKYSQQLMATGGTGTLAWSTSGTLPSSITLDPSSGLLSGTPLSADIAGSPYSFAAKVTDSKGNTGVQAYMLTVAPAPVAITTASLNAATVNSAFSQQLAATGGTGTYAWSVPAANLPPTFNLSATGLLTGNPTTTSGSPFMFTVEAMSGTATPGMMQYSLTINPGPLVITTNSPLPAGSVGQSYTTPLVATGGTGSYTWTATGGVPTGLTLKSDGTWSGTPTAANTFSFSATVVSGAANTTKAFMVTINPASTSGLVITTTSPLLPATSLTTYGNQFTASGGTPPYSWMLTSVGATPPAGIELSASGALTGLTSGSGSTTFPVTVTDHVGNSVVGSFTLVVQNPSASCTIVPGASGTFTLPDAAVGSTYSQPMYAEPALLCNANDLGYSAWMFTPGSLPPGFNLTPQTEPGGSVGTTVTTLTSGGVIPAGSAGTYTFTISWHGQDTNNPPQGQNTSQTFSLTIH